jgi:Putative Ig domain
VLLFRQDIVTTFSGETVKKLRALSLVALGILVCALVFTGCSGSHTIAITLAPASGTAVNPGQTVTITATVANDKNNQGVTWTLSGPGSLSSNTPTTVVYTAPTNVSLTTTATITATSVANTTITATESITVNAVLTITTTSLSDATLGVPYNAFVNAAGAPATFTWAVISGSLPAGLTFMTTSTSTSAEITGTPTLLGTSDFTVQVTDSAGTSVTQALSITVNKPPPLSVATGSLPAGTVNTAYSQTLQASSGVPPYTWSITAGSLPVGLALASNGAISGTPLATGTSNFTVQVVDSSTPTAQTATANLSITINAGITDNLKLHGYYAFSVRGFDPAGLFVAAGSFFADGQGNISAGLMDVNNTVSLPANQSFTGTYSIGQDGLGFMTFNIMGGGSRAFALSMMAHGNANIIEFDDSTGGGTRNSGVLLTQDTGAFSKVLSAGSYVFGFLGIDSSKSRFGVAGNFLSDGTGDLTNGLLDSDDAGSISSSVVFSGSSTAAGSGGRGTITITTAHGPAIYSFYVVNATELLVVGIDTFAPGGNPLVSGSILPLGTDFAGTSVFELTALDASGPTAESQVGLFVAASGNFDLTSDQNTGGALTSPSGSGTYNIVNGRATLTGTGFQNSQPVLYLVSPSSQSSIQAFIVGTDPAVSFGFLTPQSGAPFSDASLAGTYAGGSLAPVDPSVSNVVSIAVAGSGNLNVNAETSGDNGLSQSQTAYTTSIDPTTGRVVVMENGNPAGFLYMVSPEEFFALSPDASARVDIFQQ